MLRKTSTSTRIRPKVQLYRTAGTGFSVKNSAPNGRNEVSTPTEMRHLGRSKHRSGAQPSAELFDPNADWARRLHQNGVLSDRGASSPLGSTLRCLKMSTLTRIWHLGCSEHRSGIILVLWFVDLNEDLAPQVLETPFWSISCAKAASVAVLAFCLLVV